jgi:hypothetical protein
MRLGSGNFLNLFVLLASATNPARDCDVWQADGVQWRRQKNVHWGPVSFQIEIYELRHAARPKWALVLVREAWWAGRRDKTVRNVHWAQVPEGRRQDVQRWFARQEAALELGSRAGRGT